MEKMPVLEGSTSDTPVLPWGPLQRWAYSFSRRIRSDRSHNVWTIAKGYSLMATLTAKGSVLARCPSCDGSMSTFEWASMHSDRHILGRTPSVMHPHGRVVNRMTSEGGYWNDGIC